MKKDKRFVQLDQCVLKPTLVDPKHCTFWMSLSSDKPNLCLLMSWQVC